jgi:hypothetical protein
VRDDRIFPITRIIAALVVPFLVLAWVILYFFPDMSTCTTCRSACGSSSTS